MPWVFMLWAGGLRGVLDMAEKSGRRIVMLSSQMLPEVFGGAEQQCLRLSRALSDLGERPHVLTSRCSRDVPAEDEIDGVPVTRILVSAPPQRGGWSIGSSIRWMLAAEAWINDIFFQPGERSWGADPTPLPDLPDDIEAEIRAQMEQAAAIVAQVRGEYINPADVEDRINNFKDEFLKKVQKVAQKRAERIEDLIDDQLTEGKWEPAIKEFIKDLVTFPGAILKGPVVRKSRKLGWVKKAGKWMADIKPALTTEFYRASPFDIYPSANSRNVNDGYLFERHRLRRKDLLAMLGVPGYDEKAIRLVLDMYGMGGLRQWLYNDQIRAELEGRPNEWLTKEETIDALEFWGSVQGKLLREWGMSEKDVPDPFAEYEVNAWLIGNYVIRAVINSDPLNRRPYHVASFEKIPGAFWGYGVPELMMDVQDVCNAAARSLVNNLAMASGPMAEIHADRLASGEDITSMGPWRIWQTVSDPNGTNTPAVRFFQPSINAEALMKVFEFFSRLADEYTGIPSYTYGDTGSLQGAGKTASGLSMLMSAVSRGIKMVISHLDKAIESAIELQFIHNMLYHDDESVKGDIMIKARGTTSLLAKEQQQIRRAELLEKTNNPTDLAIMGLPGRAALLRESVKSLDIDVDDVIPEEVMQRVRADAMGAIPGQPPTQGPMSLDPAGNPAGGQANFFQAT